MEIIDLTSPTDGKEILNRKQKMRKLFRQQQKVIRQLEKKCQNPSSEEALLAQSDGSVPLESSSAVPLSQMGVEERKALIDAATKEAVVTRLLHLFPSNKDKVCHTAPFISKSDHHRQVVRVKKQLGKMPFQALKTDVCWLSSEGVSSRSRSVEGMTLAEELLKFADYVAVRTLPCTPSTTSPSLPLPLTLPLSLSLYHVLFIVISRGKKLASEAVEGAL